MFIRRARTVHLTQRAATPQRSVGVVVTIDLASLRTSVDVRSPPGCHAPDRELSTYAMTSHVLDAEHHRSVSPHAAHDATRFLVPIGRLLFVAIFLMSAPHHFSKGVL